MKNELFEKLKEINYYTKKGEKLTDEENRRCNILIESLYTIRYKNGVKTNFNVSGKNDDTLYVTKFKENEILQYNWKYGQLNNLYLGLIYSYCTEDNNGTICRGQLYKQNFNISDVFGIMLEEICFIKDDFNWEGEGQLVSYLKKKITGRVKNEHNKINEVYIKNNFQLKSLDEIVYKNELFTELLEESDMDKTVVLDAVGLKKEYKENCRDMQYLTYNEMWEFEFNYSENSRLRTIYDNERDYSDVYLCWSRRFWDGNLDHDKQTLNILSDKDIDLHISHHDEIKFYIMQYRKFLLPKQIEKIDILLNAMESENIINYNCSSKKNNDNSWEYRDDYYTLDYKTVGKILYPNRKGNCNKDIYQFIKSCRNRLEKYLIKNKKEYLIKDIPSLENIA